ncbi:putative 5'(3')-deoxyribonucleotidase [Staphylococcus aureus]|uniref:DUF1963 domain-containing protein n=1 Tax=Staphylococcus aureus TaxID=1280 RepID=UPI0005E88C76|nr:putative 5'(3')-deoxyribonucleotidase [Staphylococcus aureus]
MTRKSIAIDMDEVLADTLGEIIDAVNFRADLGIKNILVKSTDLEAMKFDDYMYSWDCS